MPERFRPKTPARYHCEDISDNDLQTVGRLVWLNGNVYNQTSFAEKLRAERYATCADDRRLA